MRLKVSIGGFEERLARHPAGRLVLLLALGGLTMTAVESVRRVVDLAELLEETKPSATTTELRRRARAFRDLLRSRRAGDARHDQGADGSRVDARQVDEPDAAPAG